MLLWGEPGIGKTAALTQLATSLNLPLTTVIASVHEPTDFSGLPIVGDGSGLGGLPIGGLTGTIGGLAGGLPGLAGGLPIGGLAGGLPGLGGVGGLGGLGLGG